MDSLERRVRRAVKLRKHAANYYKSLPLPEQANNGDDRRYAAMGHFASYTKGLPHDEVLGEVDGDAYRALLRALHIGEPRDFDAIPLGWPDPDHRQPLTNPQAGLAFDMEGIDSHLLTIPPCYQFDSKGGHRGDRRELLAGAPARRPVRPVRHGRRGGRGAGRGQPDRDGRG